MAVANAKYNAAKEQMDILELHDETGKAVVRIDADGLVHIDDSMDLDQATTEFWQSVTDFIPVNHAEAIENKVMLIRAFSLLKTLKEKNKSATSSEFEEEYQILHDHFFRPNR